jgi:iron/zinc/copper transport system permease protein
VPAGDEQLMANIRFFLDSLQAYQFLQNALIGGILVGIICGIIGCYIILRGMALIGDAISHAVLPGVAIAYMLGVSFFLGALVSALATAVAIGWISQNSKLKDDTAIGITFTAAFALGVVLITLRRGTGVDLWHILFGNVLAVSRGDLWVIFLIGLGIVLFIVLFYKELLLSTFDPVMARAAGIDTVKIHYALLLLLSLITVASLSTVGIILVVAMLITPGATAYLLTDRISRMLLIAPAVGASSAVMGVYLSYIYDTPTGASMVLVASVFFALSFLYVWLRQKQLSKTKHGVKI